METREILSDPPRRLQFTAGNLIPDRPRSQIFDQQEIPTLTPTRETRPQ